MKIEAWKSADGWRWRLVANNGETLSHSESYYSRWSCMRTARKLARILRTVVKEVGDE